MNLRRLAGAGVLAAVVGIGVFAVYWHIFPPPGLAGNTTGISGPVLPWAIEYSFADGSYSRSERGFLTKAECDAAIPRVLEEQAGYPPAHCIEWKDDHYVGSWDDLPKMFVGVPTARVPDGWAVEFIGYMGQWNRTGRYASKAACEAAIATLPKGAGGDGHCVYIDMKGNRILGSKDPTWAGQKSVGHGIHHGGGKTPHGR